MRTIFKSKSLFVILIFAILVTLGINFLERINKSNYKEDNKIVSSKEVKTIGVNIEQSQSNGEKIRIIADQMIENEKNKTIKLVNPITKIIKKNEVTEITSKYGFIINDYKKFKLTRNVNIYNKKKNFTLQTEDLNGIFNSGDMHTKSPVSIKIKNSTIEGSSLNLQNFGEYIKVFGKAKLVIN